MSFSKKLAALLATAAFAAESGAAVVYFPNEDIPIPTNFAGVSVDLETGDKSEDLAGLPDGDANFFFGGAEISNDADQSSTVPSWQPVRLASGNTDIVLNLSAGSIVDASGSSGNPGSAYASGYGSSGDISAHFPEFTPGERGYIGFSMVPNAGGPVLYGWMEVTLQTDASDLPGTIHSWAYESDPGVSIEVGIPEPGSALLSLLGLSAFVLRRRR